jgi:hypothetical protein
MGVALMTAGIGVQGTAFRSVLRYRKVPPRVVADIEKCLLEEVVAAIEAMPAIEDSDNGHPYVDMPVAEIVSELRALRKEPND